MTDLLTVATNKFAQRLPFVLYSKPHSKEVIGRFQKNKKLYILDDFSQSGFVFAPFDSHKKSVIIPENNSDLISEVWTHKAISVDATPEVTFSENDKKSFEALVITMMSEIEKGQISKIVASRKETVVMLNPDILMLYEKLFYKYPNTFRYCFYHPEVGFWMGATPEKLVEIEGTVLKTMGYAGTQKFEGNLDVIWGEKEQEEQQFVTDFILENLRDETTEINISKPYTSQAGTLLHIRTDIKAQLKNDFSLAEIINKLHPTPAVCGFPKDKAKQFILDNEGYDRSFYSGFLGELNFSDNQRSELYVNLRCMEFYDQQVSFYVGCGITKDSNPEKEFFETVNKSVTMRSLF